MMDWGHTKCGRAELQGRQYPVVTYLQGEILQGTMALRTTGQAACLVKMGLEGRGKRGLPSQS